MSLNEKLNKIKSALVSIPGASVFHYFAPAGATAPYIVWREISEGSALSVDDSKAYQSIEGYVDYFTDVELDPTIDAIQDALDKVGGYELEACQYGDPTEEDDNLIHYTWSWVVI